MESFGKPSSFGELWYAEAENPLGPWGPAIKILSHENYTFYNPRIHPEFTEPDSPVLLFEGTYTMQFANKPAITPRYDYNQILYRLDLDDPALIKAQASQHQSHVEPLESIIVSADKRGFAFKKSAKPFRPWGVNYGNHGRLMEDFWESEWETISDDFREIKELGANVVRLHLQYGKFMEAPDKPNVRAFQQLSRLLHLAETNSLYLDITGLACYRPSDVPPWYDRLSEKARWESQACFWRAVAEQCASSPAVFCYNLMNEPISPADNKTSWYSGQLFGNYDFVQYIARDPNGRSRKEIACAWIKTLSSAIREKDPHHLITVGLLPWITNWKHLSGFIPQEIAPYLDFISVHIYPKTKLPQEASQALKECIVGKPVVVEEIFPLECSVTELEAFLKSSSDIACGWLWHYDGITLKEYDELEKARKLTLAQAIWRDALRSFVRCRDQMSAH